MTDTHEVAVFDAAVERLHEMIGREVVVEVCLSPVREFEVSSFYGRLESADIYGSVVNLALTTETGTPLAAVSFIQDETTSLEADAASIGIEFASVYIQIWDRSLFVPRPGTAADADDSGTADHSAEEQSSESSFGDVVKRP